MQKPGPVSLPSRSVTRGDANAPSTTTTNEARVREAARALGFDAVGIARADEPLGADFQRYAAFVDRGAHGEMKWLADNRDVRERLDTARVLEGAKSVVCVARRYDRKDDERDPPFSKSIARYARGQDYHNAVRKKLRKLAACVRRLGEGIEARPICDDAPVLERAWAAKSGLGFIGKNGLIIIPGQGSFVLLGEVVTTLSLVPDSPIADRCGSCTRCLEACPTNAFEAPRVLDPRKCISYLTIEHRGDVPAELREKIGSHLFGCDDCQTVCPFNAAKNIPARNVQNTSNLNDAFRDPREIFFPHARWSETTLGDVIALDEDAFGSLTAGSPLRRATKDGLVRNAAIVAANTGDGSAKAALEVAAKDHPDEATRATAAWALKKLQST